MQIIIEGYQYPAGSVDKVLWEGAFQTVDGKISIGYVGYYWNDRLKDSVFVLPKVFLEPDANKQDLVFGKYKPEDVIDVSNKEFTKGERDFIYGFAVWIYRTLSVFKAANPTSDIILHEYVSQMGRGRKRLCNTFLDIVLSLIDFQKRNRDFIVFITKLKHSGYNKINWTKTVSRKQAVFVDGKTPVYASVVNRKKEMDREEELLCIFHSILKYIKDEYGFPILSELNYELIPAAKFKRYLAGYGKTRLLQIKYKYFSDKMLALWELCYTFFDQSHRISISTARKEYLLAKNFNIVFEAMIDELIGDKRKDLPDGLKDQEDGKIVDHMYSYRGLTNNDEQDRNVYYIGDSKYYKMGNRIGTESVAKQFTYARNIIQWNLNIFLDDNSKDAKYRKKFPKLRDDVTEGYNIVPNFFISAGVNKDLKYNEGNIERREGSELVSRQFENRLFDRDTLIIAHYDINFLFIVSLYARANASVKLAWKEKMRRRFRKDIQEMLQQKFKFYAMTPNEDVDAERYIKDNFRLLLGKVFAPYGDSHEESTYYSLALINPDVMPTKTAADIKRRNAVVEENEAVIECLQDAFLIKDCPLGEDPSKVVKGVPPVKAPVVPGNLLTRHYLENYVDRYVLVGCVPDQAHWDWIFSRKGKYKRDDIYNVRLGDRPGAVKKSNVKVRSPKFVVMYDKDNPSTYKVYRVRNLAVITKDRITQSGYPNPKGDYFCYILDEPVSLGVIDLPRLLSENTFDPKHPYKPIYLTAQKVKEYVS